MKNLNRVIVFAALSVSAAWSQSLDSSGNGSLKGAYRFRLLEAATVDQTTGDVTEAVAASGTITFDGAGHYTVTGAVVDSAGTAQKLTAGTYVIGAGGFGYIINPLDASDFIYGGVGQGVFVGSSTEGVVDNTFIAIPAATSAPTNASFTSSYWAGLIDFPTGSSTNLKNALFELIPNGSGTFGTITLNGQAENQGAANGSTVTQTVTGATYTFPGDGSIALTLPAPSGITSTNALFSGTRTMFVSADGNFILGYTASGYDLVFGVKALASNPTSSVFSGLYYFSSFEDTPGSGYGCGDIDSFYGSLIVHPAGEVIHERYVTSFCPAIDYETDDQTTFNSNGTVTDSYGYQYAFGDGGQAFVAVGAGGLFSLWAGVQPNVPATQSGVYLNPIGVTDVASSAPITASVAPGEWIALYGTGLSNGNAIGQGGQVFPPKLNNVQVLVNNTPAPIYSVSPTLITAILPYEISTAATGIASIQVNNNGTMSSPVTVFITDALPGVFSLSQTGVGLAAARHVSTGAVLSETNPAVPGEYIEVFLTGLGTVTPSITDGAVSSSTTLSYADVFSAGNLSVYLDDFVNGTQSQATVTFAGLAPTLTGLYQMNLQVPTGVGPGDVYLDIYTDMAEVVQIQIPMGGSSSAAVKAEDRTGLHKTVHRPLAARTRSAKSKTRGNRAQLN